MKKIKSDSGMALVWAIILLIFTTTLSIIIFSYTKNNVGETMSQSEQLSAFYVAESGIELAFTALNTDVDATSYSNTSKVKLIDVLTSTSQPEITLKDKMITYNSQDIGKVNVSIKVVEESGKTWIKIASQGIYFLGGDDSVATSIMKIDIHNRANVEREFIDGVQ